MSRLARSDRPAARGPEIWVKRLKANESVFVAVLSDKIAGFESHWTSHGSVGCTVPKEKCKGCISGRPARWRGYLHCWDLEAGKDYFLEFTDGAVRQLDLVIEKGVSWRGMRMRLRRMGGNKSRLLVETHAPWERLLNAPPLPPAADPEPSLERLYQTNSRSFEA